MSIVQDEILELIKSFIKDTRPSETMNDSEISQELLNLRSDPTPLSHSMDQKQRIHIARQYCDILLQWGTDIRTNVLQLQHKNTIIHTRIVQNLEIFYSSIRKFRDTLNN